jgi:hypothetical protein
LLFLFDVAASGIPLDQWRSQFFLHKRRNIFRLQGPVVSLAAHIPEAVDDSKGAAASTLSAIPLQDEFPPLPGSSAAAGASSSSSGTPKPGAAPTTAAAGGADAATRAGAGGSAASNLSANPLLAAFAAERQMLEQLRDDVQLKLSSFKVRLAWTLQSGQHPQPIVTIAIVLRPCSSWLAGGLRATLLQTCNLLLCLLPACLPACRRCRSCKRKTRG